MFEKAKITRLERYKEADVTTRIFVAINITDTDYPDETHYVEKWIEGDTLASLSAMEDGSAEQRAAFETYIKAYVAEQHSNWINVIIPGRPVKEKFDNAGVAAHWGGAAEITEI